MSTNSDFSKRVPLEAVIEGIEMASDDFNYFLDLETMEPVFVTDPIATGIDDSETIDLIEDKPDRFLLLPTKFEINEYRIMENFISSMEDSEAKEELSYVIIGRGAFRRF